MFNKQRPVCKEMNQYVYNYVLIAIGTLKPTSCNLDAILYAKFVLHSFGLIGLVYASQQKLKTGILL